MIITPTSSKSIITSASTCGFDTIYWDARGPGRVWELALGALEVTKRDKEKHGTGDNYVYRLEEYISRIESMTATESGLNALGVLKTVR